MQCESRTFARRPTITAALKVAIGHRAEESAARASGSRPEEESSPPAPHQPHERHGRACKARARGRTTRASERDRRTGCNEAYCKGNEEVCSWPKPRCRTTLGGPWNRSICSYFPMARPGLEPGTPRFSVSGSGRAEGAGLQPLRFGWAELDALGFLRFPVGSGHERRVGGLNRASRSTLISGRQIVSRRHREALLAPRGDERSRSGVGSADERGDPEKGAGEAAQPVGPGIAPSASLIRVQTFMLTITATISSISSGLKCSASASWKR
jgi:hypothetical protein